MTARPARGRPRVPPAVMRLGAWLIGRRCLDPALPWPVQRARLDQLTKTSLLPRGTTITVQNIAGRRAEMVSAPDCDARRTVVHFHGGGYCIGSASADSAARIARASSSAAGWGCSGARRYSGSTTRQPAWALRCAAQDRGVSAEPTQ